MLNKLKCRLFGHKWQFSENEIICERCGFFLVKQLRWTEKHKQVVIVYCAKWVFPAKIAIDFSKHTIVPLDVLQVAEAACREAKYNKTALQLRKCLTAER